MAGSWLWRLSLRLATTMAKAPRTGLKAPESESSPANSNTARAPASIWPLAARMPKAMGRSNRPDSLGKSAGARLTMIFLLFGKTRPEFRMAERTRSRASLTSVSARPTRLKLGSPLAKWTSTRMRGARKPCRVRLLTWAKSGKEDCIVLVRFYLTTAPELRKAPVWCIDNGDLAQIAAVQVFTFGTKSACIDVSNCF